jgi:hypothetical protein
MNAKMMWIPVALGAVILATTVAAQDPGPAPGEVSSEVSTSGPRDLCAQVDEHGHPTRCEPTGPGMAPWWDAQVCCDDRTCFESPTAGCATGLTAYWCGSAELHGDGTLTCVYEVPDYCDMYPCTSAPTGIDAGPLEHAICCHGIDDDFACWDPEGGPCGGWLVWCGKGATNDDGTVDCFDW